MSTKEPEAEQLALEVLFPAGISAPVDVWKRIHTDGWYKSTSRLKPAPEARFANEAEAKAFCEKFHIYGVTRLVHILRIEP